MTVEELIQELKSLGDPTMEVHFQYNYGDHWRTQVAPTVTRVEQGCVKHSDYHSTDVVVDEDDENKRGDKITTVVLLS